MTAEADVEVVMTVPTLVKPCPFPMILIGYFWPTSTILEGPDFYALCMV